jgi:hypothetical protein
MISSFFNCILVLSTNISYESLISERIIFLMFSIRIIFFEKPFFIITSFLFISIIEKKLIENKVVVTRRNIKKELRK